ncbi:hypothetical protein DSO57_1037079 [Entomophthora muscae]|uniref:Uncharacterized protein n=1 Tax=Entomophthora muscae TaxID=34485 RepID=A0ACC2SZN7_9FUNG|nr:hypothetical protein DSO57_1037079 [Entomophthora muscae]
MFIGCLRLVVVARGGSWYILGVRVFGSLSSQSAPCVVYWTFFRIDNSFPLETQAQEWDLNPDPKFLWAAGSMDQGTAHSRFIGTEHLQAEAPANSQSQNTSAGLTMVVPEEELLKLPN